MFVGIVIGLLLVAVGGAVLFGRAAEAADCDLDVEREAVTSAGRREFFCMIGSLPNAARCESGPQPGGLSLSVEEPEDPWDDWTWPTEVRAARVDDTIRELEEQFS